MTSYQKVMLYTDENGLARFREEPVSFSEGSPSSRLSAWSPAEGLQWRISPTGFQSGFHCTGIPQWLFVLQGTIEIGLRDGTFRRFRPGEGFYSADTLPEGAVFDPDIHGHSSRLIGEGPLVTVFVRGEF